MNPIKILTKYHSVKTKKIEILVTHSVMVTNLALKVAEKFKKADKKFIFEAGMLHDIGFGFPKFKINNKKNAKILKNIKKKKFYPGHCYWGYRILKKEKLKRHARVALNHIGVGISKKEIIKNNWPLPKKNIFPQTLEEEIISYADLFYSKNPNNLFMAEKKQNIIKKIKSFEFHEEKLDRFFKWNKKFNLK